MRHDLSALPFVALRQEVGGSTAIESFWAPDRTDEYGADCATGRAYAERFVRLVRVTENPTLLQRIVSAMPRGEEMSGVEIGFLTGVAAAAAGVAL